MESEDTKINGLSERRFGSIIFLLRSGGIPFQMKKIPAIYSLFMATLILSGFATLVGMLLDVIVNWNNLGRAMSTMRVLFPLTDIIWIYTYCRYVITLNISVTETQLFNKCNISVTAMVKSEDMFVQRNI
jgi:hypothetical protein